MTRKFTSLLGGSIVEYIEHKHTMGIAFKGGEFYLHDFDDYCTKENIKSLSRDAVEGWIDDRELRCPSRSRGWASYIRGFGRFLCINGNDGAYVLPEHFNTKSVRPEPYLLSNDEINRFFEAAAVFDHPSPWRWEAKAFYGLMFACGLRTCEVQRLNCNDIDMGAGTIDINWSKGPRSRRLFIDDDVVRMLDVCNQDNKRFFSDRIPFFITGRKNRVGSSAPGVIFKKIWLAAGLPYPDSGKTPRPYDFRHHFAYANIERWAAEGKEVMAMMPYLMRYMGHASIVSTCYYLHVSPDLMSKHASQVAASDCVLPEVGFDD